MKTLIPPLALLLAFSLPARADQAADLEAKLKETTESSPLGAKLMIQLTDLYWKEERVFGLIRTTSRFSRTQTEHPKRAEMTLKLIDAYTAAARHDDVIVTGKQFLEIFPNDKLLNEVRDRLATAYENTGRASKAASERRAIWENNGPADQGIRALRLFIASNNGTSYKNASSLAAAMVAKLPVNPILTGMGLQGLNAAGRSEQWTEGLQIAKALLRRKAPLDPDEKQTLWFETARFESRLGQFENAIQSFRKALTPERDDIHRSLIEAMIKAKKAPAEIEAEARRYLAAFPQHNDRYSPLGRAAHAAADTGDLSRALAIAGDALRHTVTIHDLPRAYVRWHADNHKRAEQGLLRLIEQNPDGAGTLRAVMALDLCRDAMKDPAKARMYALDYLAISPSEDGWAEHIAAYLYESATGEETFRKTLAAVTASAQKFPHLFAFQEQLWKNGPKDKTHARLWQSARRDHQNDTVTKLWQGIREKGGRSGKSCQQLLQQNLTKEQRHLVLSRLAYVYRHHLGGKSKTVAARYYQNLCQEFPKDFTAAEQWLEATNETPEKERPP